MFKTVKISSSTSCSSTSSGEFTSSLVAFFASGEVLDSSEEERSLLFRSKIFFNSSSIYHPGKKRICGGRIKDTSYAIATQADVFRFRQIKRLGIANDEGQTDVVTVKCNHLAS